MPIRIKRPKRRSAMRRQPRPAPLARRSGEDPEVLNISYRMCGDRRTTVRLAKTFMTLRDTRYPGMTLPEALAYIYLQANQIEFVFQQSYNSGRTYRGGAVIDFWIPDRGLILRINGDYYHSQPDRRERDEIQRAELLLSVIEGKRVESVVDVWESRLLGCGRDTVMRAAVESMEMGPGA